MRNPTGAKKILMFNAAKKHIVFMRRLSDGAVRGGAEKVLVDYFKHVDYQKYRITLVATHDIFPDIFKEENIPVKVVIFKEYVDLSSFKRLWVMLKKLRELKPDRLIFVHGGFRDFGASDFAGAFIAVQGRLIDFHVSSPMNPIVIKSSRRYFGIIPGFGLWWYRQMWRLVLRGMLPRKIIVLSKDAKRRIVEWYGASAGKIQVIHHGIRLDAFSPDINVRRQMREQLGIPNDDTVLIYTGRFSHEKCLERIIGAFENLQNDFSNLWLLLVGDGYLKAEIEERVRRGKCGPKIKFLGFQKQVVDFLRMSDIFVLSSDYEGLSNSMLEAMATGLVTVVTNVSGSDDAIIDGESGFIVACSEAGIRDGLLKALRLSQSEKERLVKNAMNTVNTKFDVKQGIEEMLHALELD